MIKAVMFDFDGVLTTDPTGSLTICRYIASAADVEYERLYREYRKFNDELLCGRKTHKDIWAELCQNVEANIPYNILTDSFISTPVDTEMIGLVYNLKSRGYKVGMITDNKKDRIDCIINYNGWNGLFDAVIVSADVGSGKDRDIIFGKALQKLNLAANECLFIDNQRKNLVVPGNMGMKTVYYNDQIRNFNGLLKELSKNLNIASI